MSLVCKLGKKFADSKKVVFDGEKIGVAPQNWEKHAFFAFKRQ
jgi:hypothetical protein